MKLLNRNFTLILIGQIISLFGNATLRFALPLYLLDRTGSSSLFGIVLACSFIPMVILSPIGGLLADRVNKRNIMVFLDFLTAFLTGLFLLLNGSLSPQALVLIVMMLLSGIQSLYQPSVQASIPFLQEKGNLMTANAIINQVSALANLIGPVLGGIVYEAFGVTQVVLISGICFLLSAVMELFIRIPVNKLPENGSILSIVKGDFAESIHYIHREKPVIQKVIIIVALFNLVLTSMVIVGIPVIIKIHLALSGQLYGYAQGISAAGGLAGGILVGVLANRLRAEKVWKLLLAAAATLLPMALCLLFDAPPMVSYLVIVCCYFLMMVLATMFSVQMLSFVQSEVPGSLIGKVISFVMAMSMCSQPLGQALYGLLFDWAAPQWIILGSMAAAAVIVIASRKAFSHINNTAEENLG
ncbi:MFS transporter [Eubacteriales bacterium DFI.9.88]|uniref:MFS transporter n=1 Tax=Hominibacterium faecale TaxID=2839743 RepID=UPI001D1033F1|nr:MFS transporter [Hominibacterium faecale]MCC2864729.1 MFS transporter [Anaerovorax odorimutans]MDE8733782.1 MFS transporter [Eubacteriales bacterium DFI.9.88]